MDWLTFFSKLIDSLVWPAVTLLIVYWLKDAIAQRLKGLRKLKWGDKEAEFDEMLNEAKEIASKSDATQATIRTGADPLESQFKQLQAAAELSPEGAVVAAAALAESAAIDLIRLAYPSEEVKPNRPLQLHAKMRDLLDDGRIDISLYTMFQNLRQMRNLAAHNKADISVGEAREYVSVARIVVSLLNAISGKLR